MPAKSGSSAIVEKLKKQGLAKAFDEAKDEPVKYGSGGRLSANVRGVAQLVSGKLDEYKSGPNKGKPYMSLQAVVKTPEEEAGKQTYNRMDFTNDPTDKGWKNPKTAADKMKIALNELKKLGADTSGASIEDLPDLIEALVQEAPHFQYHTTAGKQKPTPKVYENWDKKVEDFVESGTTAVEDNTEATTTDDSSEEASDTGDTDWAAIGEQADNGDSDAEKQIIEACNEAGIDYNEHSTWSEAAAAVAEAAGGDGGGDTDSDAGSEPWTPEKGMVIKYKPPGPGKAADCEIMTVFKNTLNLKRVKDSKVFKSVPFDSDERTVGGQSVDE